MLQGTFETLALPELLGLLAGARKSGALRLDAGPISGVVHLADGHCRAVETREQQGPVASGSALLARLVDVCFAVTRQESGAFRFASDEPPPWSCDEPAELSDALVELDRLLKQWHEILRVIPSLDCRPRLLDTLTVDEMVVDRERWALLVLIDGRRTVRELVQRAARSEIEVCHALLELVEAGAIGMIEPAAAATPPPPATAPPPAATPAPPRTAPAPKVTVPEVTAPKVTATEVIAPEVKPPAAATPVVADPGVTNPAADTPASATANADDEAARDEAGDTNEVPDKGAFLRLFSGLR